MVGEKAIYNTNNEVMPAVVAHTFNPTLGRQRQVDLCEFEANLVYSASSRTAKATQKNPVLNHASSPKKDVRIGVPAAAA